MGRCIAQVGIELNHLVVIAASGEMGLSQSPGKGADHACEAYVYDKAQPTNRGGSSESLNQLLPPEPDPEPEASQSLEGELTAQRSRASWFCECAAKMEGLALGWHRELEAQAGFLEAVRCNHIKYTKTWRDGAAGVQSAQVTLEQIAKIN